MNNYPDTVMALRALAIGGERRLLASAADEIERLRTANRNLLHTIERLGDQMLEREAHRD